MVKSVDAPTAPIKKALRDRAGPLTGGEGLDVDCWAPVGVEEGTVVVVVAGSFF